MPDLRLVIKYGGVGRKNLGRSYNFKHHKRGGLYVKMDLTWVDHSRMQHQISKLRKIKSRSM